MSFVVFGTVSRNMLISSFGEVPESVVFFVFFFGTVSRNLLISWPISIGILVFFWDCLGKYAHCVA